MVSRADSPLTIAPADALTLHVQGSTWVVNLESDGVSVVSTHQATFHVSDIVLNLRPGGSYKLTLPRSSISGQLSSPPKILGGAQA